jgi:DNA-binding response OmpR family regulator
MIQRLPIGQLLVETNVLTPRQLDEALAVQKRDGGRLCSVALRLGFADERALVRTLSRQLGVPAMVVTEVRPEAGGADLVPREVAERFGVLPARVFNRTLTLLMRDPADTAALNDLQFVTGKVIRPLVAVEGPLRRAIRLFYDGGAADGGSVDTNTPSPITPEVPPAPVAAEPLPEPGFSLDDLGAFGGRDDEADAADPRPRILAIDDDLSILRLYEGIFGPTLYRIHTCSDGATALDEVRRLRPQVVLLDARLPGLHGFEICRRIKEDPALASTAVILLSGAYRGWQMRADLMRHCGADDVLEKPFNLDHLGNRVTELLRNAAADRQNTGGTRALAAESLKFLNAGLLFLQKGELESAAAEFRHSIEHQPFAARPHFYLGKIHERKNERYEAMYEYERAVSLDTTFFPAIKDLALLYQNAGFVHKAIEMWQQALAVCPEPSMRQSIKDHLLRLL